jgi:hypothetical protein
MTVDAADDPTVPTAGHRVFDDTWADAFDDAYLITLAAAERRHPAARPRRAAAVPGRRRLLRG